jgi:replicative DNA helicase
MDYALDGGVANGTLFVLAARPGVGKTTLALNIAAKAAQRKLRTLFISLEMTREEIAERYLAHYADTTPAKARENAETLLPFVEGDLLIDDATRTLDGLKTVVSRNFDCDLFVIDYLQLLSAPGRDGRDSSRTQEVGRITRELKLLARDMDRPVILLCQMSRAIERDRHNREPVLSDLRESGTIEQDADYVTFLWNRNAKEAEKQESELPDMDGSEEKPKDEETVEPDLRWILRKNRFGPPDKCFKMAFNGPHFTFTHKPLGRPKDGPKQASAF